MSHILGPIKHSIARLGLMSTTIDLVECFPYLARSFTGAYDKYAKSSESTCRFDEKALHLLLEFSYHVPLKAPQSSVKEPIYFYIEDTEDMEVIVDTALCASLAKNMVHWEVQIMPHPVYSTPCPFIQKMWNNNGHIYSLDDAQGVLDSIRELQRTGTNAGPGKDQPALDEDVHASEESTGQSAPATTEHQDNRFYEFGRLTPESHPVTGLPCFSMHICQLESILQLSEQTAPLNNQEITDKRNTDKLSLLNWCCIVGPHFGLFISPSEYILMAEQLLS